MPGLIGKKIGMTSVFDENGNNIPCTVLEVGPCVVTQIKREETDGYNAVQLAFDEKKEKNTPKAMVGHFKKAGTTPKKKVIELKGFVKDWKPGDVITVDYLPENIGHRYSHQFVNCSTLDKVGVLKAANELNIDEHLLMLHSSSSYHALLLYIPSRDHSSSLLIVL